MEEEIIALLDSVESSQKKLAEENEILGRKKGEVAKKKSKIEDERKVSEEEFNNLSAKRKQFITNIDKGVLSKYERVLHSKSGLAVVPVAGSSCGGCNMNLPPQVINEVKLMHDLRFCENCTRILYSND